MAQIVMFLIGAPIAIGLAWGVYLASKIVAGFIPGVSPDDEMVMAGIAVVVSAVVWVALYRNWKEEG